eukprot:1397840-Amphidinium_carterae.2
MSRVWSTLLKRQSTSFAAMESIPEKITHDKMVSAIMSVIVDHKLLSIHALVVNDDTNTEQRTLKQKHRGKNGTTSISTTRASP